MLLEVQKNKYILKLFQKAELVQPKRRKADPIHPHILQLKDWFEFSFNAVAQSVVTGQNPQRFFHALEDGNVINMSVVDVLYCAFNFKIP